MLITAAEKRVSILESLLCNVQGFFSLKIIGLFSVFLAAVTEFLGAANKEAEVSEINENDLAIRMSQGDDEAFEILYDLYFKKIYGFVRKRVGHNEIAEDIVSHVFMKAFAARTRFTLKTSFSAWIYRIATNAVTDHYRTKKIDYELDEARHDRDAGQDPKESLDVEILRKELEAVLEKINERDRMIISLKFYSEMGNMEIAEAIGCTPNNVGVILHRALKKCEKHASPRLNEMMANF